MTLNATHQRHTQRDEHRDAHAHELPSDLLTSAHEHGDTPNAQLKRLAQRHGLRAKDLLVLAPQNDPFNSGTPKDRQLAQWFAAELGTGMTHLRRQHYARLSRPGATLPDGSPYENTDKAWTVTLDAGKHARYLNLVDADRLTDQRNPPPHIHTEPLQAEPPSAEVTSDYWLLPRIDTSALGDVFLPLPSVDVTGYEYAPSRQPRHVEVWCEKSTMNDVLLPVCARHGVNLTTASGFQSVTGTYQLLKRVMEHGKDTVVLYISDFDPAGRHMPRAVARQIEYWSHQLQLEQRVLVKQLVLTTEQVRRFQLPRVPIKDSDRRKDTFEALNGSGAVELDALEAIHPGELARIVEEAILEHRDVGLSTAFASVRLTAVANVHGARQQAISEYEHELDDLTAEIERVAGRYQAELDDLAERLAEDMRPYDDRAARLRRAVTQRVIDLVALADLPAEPEPAAPPINADEYLLDTARGFMEQLNEYRKRQ